ncbi:deazaflavin-dependent oxidoreductase, nitroreductase family [Actinokineospora alba]|uniref:Deazaflavin-dependent oxidoreductase, nitroreductase family n=2 Tax=Actinokineospora alba TaxID=504798 RepID=A0A1H0TS78_9PSEU|nr:deazaflavin-dependent oxidoreductase (nitroreductase family) [Actinokineospora alba]SDJ13385.1 deazaflavin-dependent oxidoreductase, nitroreductase family [Actinokineospora alba]SDP56655.1 deazaflavin-dependent oxidoreductase, nitroreductase family [Actinokineospora alba]
MANRIKYVLVRAFQRRILNPLVRAMAKRDILPPSTAILETTGRKTRKPRQIPVTNGTIGDTFWIVAEHGRKADYVRNLIANPRVRVKVGRTWREGTAHVLPEDDARARSKQLPHQVNQRTVRIVGTDLLTIRIDLEP